jgi:hypothetical protein
MCKFEYIRLSRVVMTVVKNDVKNSEEEDVRAIP